MTLSPTASICIPTYNYAKFLPDAIESVLAQDYPDFELLVVDNCSTDNTTEIVYMYEQKDPRVRYLRNPENLGMVRNWNRCLEEANGEYVKILCADDLLTPSCLKKSIEVLVSDSSIALVSCGRSVVTEFLEPIDTLSFSVKKEFKRGTDVIDLCLWKGNLIGEPTAVTFRKSIAGRGFNPDYVHLADLEMWFHLLEQGNFAFIPEILCKFRHHQQQETIDNLKHFSVADDEFLLFEKYVNKNYLGYSYVKKNKLKFHKALTIWDIQNNKKDRTIINKKISRHYNIYLFRMLYAAMIAKNYIMNNILK